MLDWANSHGRCVCQRSVRQETSMFKAGTLPLNIYQNAPVPGELQVILAPPQQPHDNAPPADVPELEGGDQISEYDTESGIEEQSMSENSHGGDPNEPVGHTLNFCSQPLDLEPNQNQS